MTMKGVAAARALAKFLSAVVSVGTSAMPLPSQVALWREANTFLVLNEDWSGSMVCPRMAV